MVGDVQRLQDLAIYQFSGKVGKFGNLCSRGQASLLRQDEVKRHFSQQKAENARAPDMLALAICLAPARFATANHHTEGREDAGSS